MVRFFSERQQTLTLGSAVIDLALVGAKLALGVFTGSLGLISDAVHSGLDTAASILAFVAVRTAAQPADRNHPYGHGKAENLAAYTEAILLVIAGMVIAYEAAQRLRHPGVVDAHPIALAFLGFSVVLEVGRTTLLRQVAKKTGSASIEALATDKGADLLSVAAVLTGLVAVRLGFALGDTLAAILVAILIGVAAARLIKHSIDVLMDRAVSAAEREVLNVAAAVPGVREARSARVRQAGAQLIGEVEITGRPTLPLEAAQGLAERVRQAIRERIPGIEVGVSVRAGADPTRLVERVHAAAARNGLFRDLHDVLVEREADESLHLSLHAKLPATMSMREASKHAKALEADLKRELPELARIDLHLEPLEPEVVYGRDVTPQHPELVAKIREVVMAGANVTSCKEIELSSRGGQITAYVLVTVPDDLTLEQAHDIETNLEERIKQEVPPIRDVIVRATA